MSKRLRFLLLLIVLVACFGFLWPSITWYYRTPKEAQNIALSSLEKIRDNSIAQAVKSVEKLEAEVIKDPSAPISDEYKWLKKEAKENYKKFNKDLPKEMTMGEMLNSFSFGRSAKTDEQKRSVADDVHNQVVTLFQDRYREKILKDKDYYENSVKLGLDLSGGMNIIVHADLDAAIAAQGDSVTTDNIAQFKQQAMDQAIETLTSRIDQFGLMSPVIRQQGEDRIYIEIPGAAQADSINALIMGKGILNFRIVDDEATQTFQQYYATSAESVFDENGKLLDPSVIPEDDEVFGQYIKDSYGLDQLVGYLVLKKQIGLEGRHIKNAVVSRDDMGAVVIHFTLDTEGGDIFADLTTQNKDRRLAIVSDNRVKSAPTIKSPITAGQGQIDGFSLEEAQNLQKVLQSAWLTVPLSVESQQVIGASLGEQAINAGIKALLVGLVAIMIFMLIWYKGAGFNAIVAQVLNLYILFSFLSAFNLTLTLSSIAGMILTIGMAVDANVIIFERIKEELMLGKSRSAAITSGFGGAFWAIMDSNITTFIAAMFLSQLGTGAIQGFAVSLAIGVVSSVFTALFVSRLMFDFGTDVMHSEHVSISWRVK